MSSKKLECGQFIMQTLREKRLAKVKNVRRGSSPGLSLHVLWLEAVKAGYSHDAFAVAVHALFQKGSLIGSWQVVRVTSNGTYQPPVIEQITHMPPGIDFSSRQWYVSLQGRGISQQERRGNDHFAIAGAKAYVAADPLPTTVAILKTNVSELAQVCLALAE